MNYGVILTYDNGSEQVVFRREGDFWLTKAPNLSGVDVEVSESRTAGQVGTSITAQAVKSKTLIFTGSIMRNVENNREKLIRVVQPGVTARITYTYNGMSWYLEGAPTQTPLIGDGIVLQDFQFQVRVAFPYWRDANNIKTNIAGLSKQFHFPFYTGGQWYISTFSESYYTAIINRGNVEIGMVIQINAAGAMSNPQVLNMKTGQKIELQRDFVAGESAEIVTDFGKRAVRLTDANGIKGNGFKFLSGDSDIAMMLQPGENVFRFHADAGRELARVSITSPQMGVLSGV